MALGVIFTASGGSEQCEASHRVRNVECFGRGVGAVEFQSFAVGGFGCFKAVEFPQGIAEVAQGKGQALRVTQFAGE